MGNPENCFLLIPKHLKASCHPHFPNRRPPDRIFLFRCWGINQNEYFSSANQPLERWEYVGDLVLRNGALFQVAVPDGRVVFANGTWNYELHYTDHLGNVRASINRQGQLISSSHFDPWGHRLQGFIPRGQGNSNYNASGQLVSDANEVLCLRACAH